MIIDGFEFDRLVWYIPMRVETLRNMRGISVCNMKVLIVGPHEMQQQKSMTLYAQWLATALAGFSEVDLERAPSIFLRELTSSWSLRKYLFYLDQFIILPLLLFFRQFSYDAIIIADHSNAPSSFFIARRKLLIMVHDSIAIRGAFGELQDYEVIGPLGVLLQKLIVIGLRRASWILANPGPLERELRDLGISAPITTLGCPLDAERFDRAPAKPPHGANKFGNYALYVGSDNTRKRKSLLVDIWSSDLMLGSDLTLVMAGSTSRDNKDRFYLRTPRVVCIDHVSDSELRWLYENCSCLITASAFEGFCIPILEAVFFDRCVITPARIPFYTQVFGTSVCPVLEFDGRDARRILDTLQSFDAERDRVVRQSLLTKYSFDTFRHSLRDALTRMIGALPR
jgi:hypothetical protein